MTQEKRLPEMKQAPEVEMEKSLELVKDPALKETLTRIMERLKQTDIYKEARELRQKIVDAPKQPEQLILAFIPHEMAKVSIFFPMSDRELKEERRIIHKLPPIESNWGKVEIEGVKLAIFEEDIFLVLMKIARERIQLINGQYLLETNVREVSKILYGEAGYTKRAYELIKRALDHFELVRFELTLFKKGQKKGTINSIGGIIQDYILDEHTLNLKVYFNPHFLAYFLESMLTNINFSLRRQLKKDGSKALLRFLSTHTQPNQMHILTVLKAINYNVDQPMPELRRKFKQFIAELRKNGVLGPKTRLSNDIVYFDVLPLKALPE